MEKALIETSEVPERVVLDAEILRKTYEVMLSVGIIELVIRLAF